jgi:hypothetical protein
VAPREARAVLDSLSRLMPELSETDRASFTEPFDQLQKQVGSRPVPDR